VCDGELTHLDPALTVSRTGSSPGPVPAAR